MAYHPESLRILSAVQIIAGSISLVLVIIYVRPTGSPFFLGTGIGFGVWIILAGIFGLLGCRDSQVPHKGLLGTFMGCTIVACAFSFPFAGYLILASIINRHGGVIAFLFIVIFEFAVGLASSIICCGAVCCNNSSRVQGAQQVVYLQPGMEQVSTAGGEIAVLSGGTQGTVVQPPPGQFIIQQPGQPVKDQEASPAYNDNEQSK